MTRINAIRNSRSLSWGKNIAGDLNAYAFAALLILCSVAVGCSGEKPKPISSTVPTPQTQPITPAAVPAPPMLAENKPAPKKPAVHRKPATVNYADKTSGVMFEYPRRYAIETGDAATQLLASNPLPMNFVQPGGVALAAVELPETNYVNTDFSSAYFEVSVNKNVSAEQCGEFAVPQSKPTAKSDLTASSPDAAKPDAPSPDSSNGPKTSDDLASKLLVGDLELRATEAVSGEGTRQSDSKYFHAYQNGACYEFALNVTTDASEEGLVKHVDRDRVFNRLEQILATVKINAVTPEVTADAPAPSAAEAPAQ